MAANHAIKFFMIAKLFHEDPKILQDGENAYTSNHVKFMRYIGNVRPAVLEGQVQARMKKTVSCAGDSNVVGFSWLLKPEANEEMISLIPSIEDILYCQEYIEAEDKQSYVSRQCALNIDQIRKIAAATVGQHSNELWLITHKLRLTSSKFGLILGAYKRNIETGRSFPKSLFTSLVEGYSLSKVMAVQWGRHNEGTATKQFEELHMLRINQTGLWLDESGFLGASPDGLIGDDATLDVKCPYKMRNCTIREGVQDALAVIVILPV
nr:unnamed protein product [Callosobruchus analis]